MQVSGVKTLPILVLVLVMTGSLVVDQGKAYACGSTFFSALVQLIPCRAAVAPFSPIPPSDACCSAVKALGQPCLCVLVNGPPISGVDRNMALQLPDKCTANFEPCEITK
ncbi:protein LIM1 [Ricinus communis]|uniref:Lipid binding protein, putative n=1 Tax=Ricinus communis TaxID=3988 RepID=B9RHJ2_RICCO|nr:protein LIM1 [Ricinus communis]EEF49202.1 lipid binding protein, putative [Ricinus communis]